MTLLRPFARLLLLGCALAATLPLFARDWFVDASAATSGDGSEAAPFATLAAAQKASAPADTIHVRAGSYSGGIALMENQTLAGDEGAIVANESGDAITLASGATVSRITIRAATHAALRGNGVRDLTLRDVHFELTGDADGIVLTNGSGAATIGGAITGSGSGVALRLDGGDAVVDVRGLAIEQKKGAALELRNLAGGSVTFDDQSTASTSAAARDAVVVIANKAPIVLPTLRITAASATALIVQKSASVTLRGAASVLATKGARCVHVADSNIDFDLRSVSVDGGIDGILLERATGTFLISGEGTTAGSGGTIRNTRTRGIAIAKSSGITIRNMTLENAVTENGKCASPPSDADARDCNAAVHLSEVEKIAFEGLRIHGSKQFAISGHGVRDLSITGSEIRGAGDETLESGVYLRDVAGELRIIGTTLRDNAARQLDIAAATGELTIDIRESTIDGAEPPFGQQGIVLTAGGDAHVRLLIEHTTIVDNFSNALHVTAAGSAEVDARISENTFRDNASAVLLTPSDKAKLTYRIADNKITESRSTALTVHSTGAAVANGAISGNVIGVQGKAGSGASCEGGGCGGIIVRGLGRSIFSADIAKNTLQQIESGITIQASDSVDARLRITGNIIREPVGANPRPAISIVTGIRDKDLSSLCLELGGEGKAANEISGGWNGGGPAIHIRRRFPNSRLALAGYAGDRSAAANAAKFVAGRNRGAAVVVEMTGELTLADRCSIPSIEK